MLGHDQQNKLSATGQHGRVRMRIAGELWLMSPFQAFQGEGTKGK